MGVGEKVGHGEVNLVLLGRTGGRENRLEGKKTGRLNSALSLSQNIEYIGCGVLTHMRL